MMDSTSLQYFKKVSFIFVILGLNEKIVWDADGSVHNLGEFLKISEDKVLSKLGMAESLLKYERFGIVLSEGDLLRFFN